MKFYILKEDYAYLKILRKKSQILSEGHSTPYFVHPDATKM